MSLKDTLTHLGIEPKKSLGQNFMVEPAILDQIADAAEVGPEDCVLEIGAGLGVLTAVLARRARRVIALEIDSKFIPVLHQDFADQPQVEVVQGDVLKFDIFGLLGDDLGNYKVAANLPYYITSPILRLFLEGDFPPYLMVTTVQYEVAERMVATPNDMNLLAVGVQLYGSPQIIRRLSPGIFYPQPRVDSALIRIDPHPDQPIPPEERKQFFRMVRAGFSQPRKQVKNALAAGLHLDRETVVNWLTAAEIDPRRRAETLSLEDWLTLHDMADRYLKTI